MCSDVEVIVLMEAVLLVVFILSLSMDVIIFIRKRRGSLSLTIKRGERSMNALYVIYGTATVIYALEVQVSEAFIGNKVFLIAVNYVVLTYLFFFSSWFRNRILFPLLSRIKED